jgi:hypothetical protein
MQPEQLAKDTEHSQQAAFFCWLQQQTFDERLKFAFAIPNGGERNVIVASRLKAEGVKQGVPDVCIPIPAGIYAGMWIEFKRPGTETQRAGKLSTEQEKWRDFLISQHYFHIVAFEYLSAVESVLRYLR